MQIWADERAQLAKFLICKYEDLRSIPINQIRNLGTVWKRRQEAPWGLLNSYPSLFVHFQATEGTYLKKKKKI